MATIVPTLRHAPGMIFAMAVPLHTIHKPQHPYSSACYKGGHALHSGMAIQKPWFLSRGAWGYGTTSGCRVEAKKDVLQKPVV